MKQQTVKKILFFLLVCFVCPQALATVFSVIPTDKSQAYLGTVFGGSIGSIYLSADSSPTLAMMFEKFNYIILTAGVMIVSYIGVVSTINTAREGQALGSKMSMWVPMRAFLGMLLMVPGPTSGYCVIQMTVMWVVLNGVGAANSVWNIVVDQIARDLPVISVKTNLTYNASDANAPATSIDDMIVQPLMHAATCMQTLNSLPQLSEVPTIYTEYGPIRAYIDIKDPSPEGTDFKQKAYMNIGMEGAPAPYNKLCGQFTIEVTKSKALVSQYVNVYVNALQTAFSSLEPIGSDLAAGGMASPAIAYEDISWDKGYREGARNAYYGQILKTQQLDATEKAIQSRNESQYNPGLEVNFEAKTDISSLKQFGWIHAGSFYFSMVKSGTLTDQPVFDYDSTVVKNSDVPMHTSTPTTAVNGLTQLNSLLTDLPVPRMSEFNYAQNLTDEYFKADISAMDGVTIEGLAKNVDSGDGFLNLVVEIFGRPVTEAIVKLAQDVTGAPGDPLVALGKFGTTLMISAEMATFLALIGSMIGMIAASVMSCANPMPWGLQTLFLQVIPLLYGVLISLWMLGATAGIYLPLVPYIMFTGTAFGWIISVIEAIVGAPVVALALAHPSGEEMGKVGSPLAILANVFLRPTLMIFGFVLGATLLRAGLDLLNNGFIAAVRENTMPTMFSALAVLGLYMGLVSTIINKSFSLIYMLPNQIMRWMGGPTESSSVGEEMSKEAKGGFDGGAQAGQTALQGVGDAAAGAAGGEKGIGKHAKVDAANSKAAEGRASDEAKETSADRHKEMMGALNKGGGGGDMPGGAPPAPPG